MALQEAPSPRRSRVWYRKALDLGHNFAAGRLYLVCQEHSPASQVLPDDLQKLLGTAKTSVKKDESPPVAFARLITEARVQAARTAALAAAKGRREQMSQLDGQATAYHELAQAYGSDKERRDKYRKALNAEYDIRGQQLKLEPTNTRVKESQADDAAKLARSYLESKETAAELLWTMRAANLSHAESMLTVADWYEKGIHFKVDLKKANRYRYLGHDALGKRLFGERRYADALPDLEKVCELAGANADDHDTLAMCYGKLGRWDEAIKSYTRSIELDLKSASATGVVLNLLEALTCAERPEQLLQFVETIEKKGWVPPKEGTSDSKYAALFHGFQAICAAGQRKGRFPGRTSDAAVHRQAGIQNQQLDVGRAQQLVQEHEATARPQGGRGGIDRRAPG